MTCGFVRLRIRKLVHKSECYKLCPPYLSSSKAPGASAKPHHSYPKHGFTLICYQVFSHQLSGKQFASMLLHGDTQDGS